MWAQKLMQKLVLLGEKYQNILVYPVIALILTAFIHLPIPWSLFGKYKFFVISSDFLFWLIITYVTIELVKKIWRRRPL